MKNNSIKKNSTITILILAINLIVVNISFAQLTSMRAFMQAGATPKNAIPYGNNTRAGHYIKSADAKIYYEVYGKGKPLVILHGGVFGSTFEMGRLIDSLSKYYRVIAVSTRGHGRSEMGSLPPSYEQKAKDVSAIIKAETKDSVTVLGFSDGAYTGYYLASAFPEQVQKMIAIGAGEWKKGSRSFNLSREMAFGLDSLYWRQQMEIMPDSGKMDSWFASLNTYYNTFAMGDEILGRIKCPVMVLAGELDENAPLLTVIDAYKKIPKAQLAIVPNAPHPAFLVNFNAVWADILPFLGAGK